MSVEAPYVSPYSCNSHRFRICLLMMFGLAAITSMRVNLSMAVVCMVNSTAFQIPEKQSFIPFKENDSCPNSLDDDSTQGSGYNGELLWSPQMTSLLFSATFYGALLTTGFSGYFADRFGPKIILLAVAADYLIVTLLTPLLARESYYALFAGRIVMGLGEGFTFPCLNSAAGKWFGANERSSMAAIFTSGNQLAMIIASLISASLCASPWGWPSIFYSFGSVGIIWAILWVLFFSNHPSTNKWISQEEKEYLADHVPKKGKKASSPPWKSMLTSVPVWAAISCQYCFNMQAGLLQAFVPTYLKEELHLPITSNGIYSTIPFINQLVFKNIFGIFADKLKQKNIISHTFSVKLFQVFSSTVATVAMLALAFLPSCNNTWIAHVILGFIGLSLSACIPGFYTSMLSLAPDHSGTMGSICMIFGNLGNLTGPLILSFLNVVTPESKWTNLFLICAVINVICGIFFCLCGSAEKQPWSTAKISDEDTEKNQNNNVVA